MIDLITKMPVFLQGLWVIWLGSGIFLFAFTANHFQVPELIPEPAPVVLAPQPPPPPPPPPKPKPQVAPPSTPYKVDQNWDSFPMIGQDNAGKQAYFEVVILSQEYHWKFKSTTTLLDKSEQMVDVASLFKTSGMQSWMKNSLDIICVGAASSEGQLDTEEKRAYVRADQCIEWLRETVPFSEKLAGIYLLNLGQYADPCEDCDQDATASQRGMIVISVIKKAPDIDLTDALRDALLKREFKGFEMQHYSLIGQSSFMLESRN